MPIGLSLLITLSNLWMVSHKFLARKNQTLAFLIFESGGTDLSYL